MISNKRMSFRQVVSMPSYSPRQIEQLTAEILDLRVHEHLTATETCNEFLLMNVVPPSELVLEHEKECRLVNDAILLGDSTLTDEQIKDIKNRQNKKHKAARNTLVNRRIDNKRMYSEHKNIKAGD